MSVSLDTQLRKYWINYIQTYPCNYEPVKFSSDFSDKIKTIYKSNRTFKKKKIRYVLLAAAILILMLIGTALAIPSIRHAVKLAIDSLDTNSTIIPYVVSNAPESLRVTDIEADIPPQYSLDAARCKYGKALIIEAYTADNRCLVLQKSLTSLSSTSINTENSDDIILLDINGAPGILYTSGNIQQLLWYTNEFYYSIVLINDNLDLLELAKTIS